MNIDTGCRCRWFPVDGRLALFKEYCPVHEDIAAIFDESANSRARRDPSTGITVPPNRQC